MSNPAGCVHAIGVTPLTVVADALIAIAETLGAEADAEPRDCRKGAWEHASDLVYAQAGQAVRMAAKGATELGVAHRLGAVCGQLTAHRLCICDPIRESALVEVVDRLHAYTQGSDYRVTLIVTGQQRLEVVVRAPDRFVAAQRAMSADRLYLVGPSTYPEQPIDVVSVAQLTETPELHA